MPPTSLQIYIRPRMTLIFDLLTPKLTVLCPCHVNHLCQLTAIAVHSFQNSVHKFGNRRTNGQTDTLEHNASACQYGLVEA